MTELVDKPTFERVYTMTDYYDGPRAGIANFEGKPHAYRSPFNDAIGYEEVYELRPVDEETLRLALEDWEIWLRWEEAYRAGLANRESHPALPDDRARHDEIVPVLETRLAALPGPIVRAHGRFQAMPGHTGARGLWMEVQWTVVR